MNIIIREPLIEDADAFLLAMNRSVSIHSPWVSPPKNFEEYNQFLLRIKNPNQKGFLVEINGKDIAGIFNLNEIVHGYFQSAYLGFYATKDYVGSGVMSKALKLLLRHIFKDIKLHRVEANIQPENKRSINLVLSNGFKREGYSPKYLKINGEWRDHERWAILYEDWKLLNNE